MQSHLWWCSMTSVYNQERSTQLGHLSVCRCEQSANAECRCDHSVSIVILRLLATLLVPHTDEQLASMASDKPAKNELSEFYQKARRHDSNAEEPLYNTIQLRWGHDCLFQTTLKLPSAQIPLLSLNEQVGGFVLMLQGTSPKQWQEQSQCITRAADILAWHIGNNLRTLEYSCFQRCSHSTCAPAPWCLCGPPGKQLALQATCKD